MEEVVVAAPPWHMNINSAKRKRTKRLRAHSPIPLDHRLSPNANAATEEEEDTARCLILLAQGRHAASCTYTCKTCNRAFSSFQALGGHRTSHKKPKNLHKKSPFFYHIDQDFPPPSKKRMPPYTLSLQLNSSRIHECSYCGAEFTSGQALGGHMRRHRAPPISPELKNPTIGLSLDLNYPAPEDELQFDNMVLSTAAPTLVDCHF